MNFNFDIIDKVSFERMWPDDVYWFPYLLAGKMFRGKFYFDKPSSSEYQAKILSEELEEVDFV